MMANGAVTAATPRTVVVAAVQQAPALLDLPATLARVSEAVAQAASAGAQLVALPETHLPGYPSWIFGAAGWDDPAAKRAHARLLENAVTVPGAACDELCRLARRHKVVLVAGANELDRSSSGGTLFNSQLFISAEGELLGVHRKLMPTHAERIVWGQGDGSTLHVLDTPLGRLGGLVCWEHWMPLTRFAMHAQGEELHVAAWPEGTAVTELASRSYAFEGRCFVVAASPFMRRSDLPGWFELSPAISAAFPQSADDDVLLDGGSGVIGPDGEWVAGPVRGEETVVLAEVDLRRRAEELLVFDAAGHYSRPDVFQLRIDPRRRTQLTWAPGEEPATTAEVHQSHD
jgi:predicted amidohydrolase